MLEYWEEILLLARLYMRIVLLIAIWSHQRFAFMVAIFLDKLLRTYIFYIQLADESIDFTNHVL